MKRLLVGVTSLGVAILLCGCPIYSDSGPGSVAVMCDGVLEDCPTTECTDACIPWQCASVGDCPSGYACQQNLCGSSTSDCRTTGCGAGFICKVASGTASCVAFIAPSADAGPRDASVDVGVTVDAARSDLRTEGGGFTDVATLEASTDATSMTDGAGVDATTEAASRADATGLADDGARQTEADAMEAGSDGDGRTDAYFGEEGGDSSTESDGGAANLCNADVDCTASTPRCVDGRCASTGSLCSDGTQCNIYGFRCVDGFCEPPCSGGSPVGCPVGYACDTAVGACSLNPDPCTGSGPSTCPTGSVCVEQRCVAACLPSEAGPACSLPDHVCVNGGCIPDEGAKFTCTNGGQGSLPATLCAVGSVCLHHDCYVQCDVASDSSSACADPSRTCKEVTVSAGTYAVCAPPGGLGSECDVAAMVGCPSGHSCVDGYCK